MKYAKLWVLLVAVIVGASVAIYLDAQAKSETKTVTGCLQKGDEPNEYSITDTSGKIYEMRSSEVKLADHLGHKVTVTGRMKGERDEDEDEEREAKGSKKEAGYIQVTKLTMVSTSCE